MLVIEGVLPLISPASWRRMFEQLFQLGNGQIRFFGLCSMLLGFAILWLAV